MAESSARNASGFDPFSAAEIAAALRAVHTESLAYWSAMSDAEFLSPIGDAWSPADNVRHLTKSMRAVAQGLRTPRVMLWFAFRTHAGPSRRYAEIRDTYRARLAKGADAGKFGPGQRTSGNDGQAEREKIMRYHASAVEELAALTRGWSERALDKRQLPHPLLGKLSVREMLLFTVYHNRHHVDVVRRRRGEAVTDD